MTNKNSDILEIKKVEEDKDLGVIADSDLKFNTYCHTISNTNFANRNLGIIHRTFTYLVTSPIETSTTDGRYTEKSNKAN